jgi:large subunit ribosomal protein L7/L12
MSQEDKKMAVKKDDVVEFISGMSVLELSEFIKELEEKFGVSAAAPVAVAAAGAAPADAGAPAEEKTDFDVVLAGIGDQKIKVIKEVRAITSLGLKEAKELVESAPQPIKEGVSKEEAQEIKEKIEAVGGSVELK